MKKCVKAGCEEEAVRGMMYCNAHRPGPGTKIKKMAGARKGTAKKAARKAAKKR